MSGATASGWPYITDSDEPREYPAPSLALATKLEADVALKNHTHTQAQTHASADTDTAASALHHTLGTGAFQAAPGNHSNHSLDSLSDVGTGGAINGQALVFNGTSWTPGTVSGGGGGGTLDSLTDVDTSGVINGQSLVFNGGTWGPVTVSGGTGGSGSVILSGTISPTGAIGSVGDYYLDTDNRVLYGPKTGASGWPVALVSVPAAGILGQVLGKTSSADFAAAWITPAAAGGGGSTGSSSFAASLSGMTPTITHNLGTKDVSVTVYRVSDGREVSVPSTRISDNAVMLNSAVNLADHRIVVFAHGGSGTEMLGGVQDASSAEVALPVEGSPATSEAVSTTPMPITTTPTVVLT